MGLEVRRANEGDLDWLLGQLRKFSVHLGTKLPLYGGDEQSRGLLGNFISTQTMFVVGSDEVGPVGFIGGWKYSHPFNPTIQVLTLGFWWVAEEHRRSRAALMLLDKFTETGKQIADWVTFSVGATTPIFDATLERRGFRLTERQYMMEVECQQ